MKKRDLKCLWLFHHFVMKLLNHYSTFFLLSLLVLVLQMCSSVWIGGAGLSSVCPRYIFVSFFSFVFLFCMHSFVKQNRDALSRRSSISSIQSPWVISLLHYPSSPLLTPPFALFCGSPRFLAHDSLPWCPIFSSSLWTFLKNELNSPASFCYNEVLRKMQKKYVVICFFS